MIISNPKQNYLLSFLKKKSEKIIAVGGTDLWNKVVPPQLYFAFFCIIHWLKSAFLPKWKGLKTCGINLRCLQFSKVGFL